jgi:hypothetical protein
MSRWRGNDDKAKEMQATGALLVPGGIRRPTATSANTCLHVPASNTSQPPCVAYPTTSNITILCPRVVTDSTCKPQKTGLSLGDLDFSSAFVTSRSLSPSPSRWSSLPSCPLSQSQITNPSNYLCDRPAGSKQFVTGRLPNPPGLSFQPGIHI